MNERSGREVIEMKRRGALAKLVGDNKMKLSVEFRREIWGEMDIWDDISEPMMLKFVLKGDVRGEGYFPD